MSNRKFVNVSYDLLYILVELITAKWVFFFLDDIMSSIKT